MPVPLAWGIWPVSLRFAGKDFSPQGREAAEADTVNSGTGRKRGLLTEQGCHARDTVHCHNQRFWEVGGLL